MALGYVCTSCHFLNSLSSTRCQDCGLEIVVPGSELARVLAELGGGSENPFGVETTTDQLKVMVDVTFTEEPEVQAEEGSSTAELTSETARAVPSARAKPGVGPADARSKKAAPTAAESGVVTGGAAEMIFNPPTIPPDEGLKREDIVPSIRSEEDAVERSENLICSKCNSLVHPGHKFCGKCGTPVEEFAAQRAPTQEFGPMQQVGKAKLVLIKGEGFDGISYHLNAKRHVAGRSEGQILFPDDAFLSPKHTNFFYEEGRLFLQDEGSLNGTYIRVRERDPIRSGDFFLAGEEIFRFEELAPPEDQPDSDGTKFFASPMRPSRFRIVQILTGGREGLVYSAKRDALVIGRERCDVNFPTDRYMSGSHVKIEATEGGYFLVDMGSKNGTFLRVTGQRELQHGDYTFIGQQLLRVEITTF